MAPFSRIDRSIYDLVVARDCALEGARISTIAHLTALSEKRLRGLLDPRDLHAARGRLPNTRDWFHTASLPQRIEASILMTDFEHSRALGFRAAESLVAALRFVRRFFAARSRMSFDRAFDLGAHTAGLWIADSVSFRVSPCPTCGRHRLHVACNGPVLDRCIFCRLVERVAYDKRLVAALPPVPTLVGPGQLWSPDRVATQGVAPKSP
jgi:flagellar transcriptional activator FlhC